MKLHLSLIVIFSILCWKFSQGRQLTPKELYGDIATEEITECIINIIDNTGISCQNVDKDGMLLVEDYLCRYFSVNLEGRGCSCCGYYYAYIELGNVCTRYCGQTSQGGLDPLITLPFNWGDECPEKIYLVEGNEWNEVPHLKRECEENAEKENEPIEPIRRKEGSKE